MADVVLITGSNGSIGYATASKFLEEGYNVILNYHINHDNIDELILKYPTRTEKIKADVTLKDEVEAMIEQIIVRHGSIDVLINNAGIIRDKSFIKMSDADWDEVLATNINGVYFVTKAALKRMIKQKKGNIVNISSIVGIQGSYGQVNYSASKAAIIGITKSLSKEVAKYDIAVNAIAPGYIDTDMTKSIPPEIREKMISLIPIGRMGTANEIASAIFHITKMPYVTGAIISANGGIL